MFTRLIYMHPIYYWMRIETWIWCRMSPSYLTSNCIIRWGLKQLYSCRTHSGWHSITSISITGWGLKRDWCRVLMCYIDITSNITIGWGLKHTCWRKSKWGQNIFHSIINEWGLKHRRRPHWAQGLSFTFSWITGWGLKRSSERLFRW